MNAIIREVIGRAEHWPEEDQEKLAQVAVEIELRRKRAYSAPAEELRAIDEALAVIADDRVAADSEVEALLAKYRNL